MLTGTARKGDWGVFYDFVYVNIGDLKIDGARRERPGRRRFTAGVGKPG